MKRSAKLLSYVKLYSELRKAMTPAAKTAAPVKWKPPFKFTMPTFVGNWLNWLK